MKILVCQKYIVTVEELEIHGQNKYVFHSFNKLKIVQWCSFVKDIKRLAMGLPQDQGQVSFSSLISMASQMSWHLLNSSKPFNSHEVSCPKHSIVLFKSCFPHQLLWASLLKDIILQRYLSRCKLIVNELGSSGLQTKFPEFIFVLRLGFLQVL